MDVQLIKRKGKTLGTERETTNKEEKGKERRGRRKKKKEKKAEGTPHAHIECLAEPYLLRFARLNNDLSHLYV